MANKEDRQLAYDAGRAALSEPPERRSIDACPFSEGTDERGEWLRGFADALDEQPDVSALRRQIREARGDA